MLDDIEIPNSIPLSWPAVIIEGKSGAILWPEKQHKCFSFSSLTFYLSVSIQPHYWPPMETSSPGKYEIQFEWCPPGHNKLAEVQNQKFKEKG